MNLIKSIAATPALALCLSLAPLLCGAGETCADKIKDAWKEYQYREFDTAQSLFSEAERLAASKEDRVQALSGQAFCYQFGKRALATASDYEAAIALYRKSLEIAAGDPRFEPFLKSMLAECAARIYFLNGDEAKLKEAKEIWDWLQASCKESIVAQDSMLFKTVNMTKSFTDDANLPQMQVLEARLAESKGKSDGSSEKDALSSVMASYLSTVYYWRGDYKGSVEWLKRYIDYGPTSYSAKTNAYFKVARVSEIKLDDRKTACEYYGVFAKSFPTDRRNYFSALKAKEFESLQKEVK